MSKRVQKVQRMEAMHIVACALDIAKKEKQFGAGSPEHKAAIELEAQVIRIWKGQLWGRNTTKFCPHCHKEI